MVDDKKSSRNQTRTGAMTCGDSKSLGSDSTDTADARMDSSLVVISTYTVEDAQNAYDLVRELNSLAKDVLSPWGAFRSLTLHLSQDYRQVLAYETWTDRSAFLTAWDSEDVRSYLERIKVLFLSVDARVFTVESCVIGSTEGQE